ncbi:MAG: carboxymuconolactone decarboxylase family protein [Betaproteobacteria bacterium]|nr:carboxymuconolactone decarboxylase family protein [Betaproteobacteria bacterium]
MSASGKNGAANGTVCYTVLPERMPPLAPENYNELQKKVAADLSSSRGSVRGPYGAMLRSPELADCMQKVGQYVRFKCGLDKRLNRLAGMLATRHWCNQYEWNGHVPYALKAGMAQPVIDAIGEGRRPAELRDDEAAVYDFVTELYANKGVSDTTYARALQLFGEAGIVDILGVVGYYATNAMIMNVARTAVPGERPMPLIPLPQQLAPLD